MDKSTLLCFLDSRYKRTFSFHETTAKDKKKLEFL